MENWSTSLTTGMVMSINKLILRIFTCTCILLLSVESYGQMTPSEEFTFYKNKYPDDHAAFTSIKKKLIIDTSGDSLKILLENYEEIIILGNPLQRSKDKAYSSSFSKIIDIEAYTLLPGKKKYEKIDVKDFKKSFDTNSFVFYDDSEVISYNYPQITEGAKIVTKKVSEISDPHLISQFYFSAYIPTQQVEYEIIYDGSIELKHGLLNEKGFEIKFERKELSDNKIQLKYSASDIEKISYESDSPKFSYLTASAFVRIARYKTKSGREISILDDLEDLHIWYKTFIENLAVDDDVKNTAATIVNKEDSINEKIRKIFYWVQKNVKYIAFEQGMRGFIPNQANYVIEKRYGDCKDMTSILVALLRSQDIDAHFTWIGTRDLPYSYNELPSPVVDNHMIASVELNGETIFLDATGSYSPLGFPTSMIQGKESLISTGDDYKIVKVPVIPKEQNQMIDTSFIKLDKNNVIGNGRLELTGLVKVANTYKLISKSEKHTEDYLRRLLSRGSNKFFLIKYGLENLENLDQPIIVDYEFEVKDYCKFIGEEIYVNLILDKSLVNDIIKNRKVPIENDYKYINRSVTVLDIPENYQISFLPENIKSDSENFGFDINYKVQANKILATKSFYVDYLLMMPENFEEWNVQVKKYSQAVRNTIVLNKKPTK